MKGPSILSPSLYPTDRGTEAFRFTDKSRSWVGFLYLHLELCAVGSGPGYGDNKTDMGIRPEGAERESRERQTSRKRQNVKDVDMSRGGERTEREKDTKKIKKRRNKKR